MEDLEPGLTTNQADKRQQYNQALTGPLKLEGRPHQSPDAEGACPMQLHNVLE